VYQYTPSTQQTLHACQQLQQPHASASPTAAGAMLVFRPLARPPSGALDCGPAGTAPVGTGVSGHAGAANRPRSRAAAAANSADPPSRRPAAAPARGRGRGTIAGGDRARNGAGADAQSAPSLYNAQSAPPLYNDVLIGPAGDGECTPPPLRVRACFRGALAHRLRLFLAPPPTCCSRRTLFDAPRQQSPVDLDGTERLPLRRNQLFHGEGRHRE
jgi:hypothetical protein